MGTIIQHLIYATSTHSQHEHYYDIFILLLFYQKTFFVHSLVSETYQAADFTLHTCTTGQLVLLTRNSADKNMNQSSTVFTLNVICLRQKNGSMGGGWAELDV